MVHVNRTATTVYLNEKSDHNPTFSLTNSKNLTESEIYWK